MANNMNRREFVYKNFTGGIGAWLSLALTTPSRVLACAKETFRGYFYNPYEVEELFSNAMLISSNTPTDLKGMRYDNLYFIKDSDSSGQIDMMDFLMSKYNMNDTSKYFHAKLKGSFIDEGYFIDDIQVSGRFYDDERHQMLESRFEDVELIESLERRIDKNRDIFNRTLLKLVQKNPAVKKVPEEYNPFKGINGIPS